MAVQGRVIPADKLSRARQLRGWHQVGFGACRQVHPGTVSRAGAGKPVDGQTHLKIEAMLEGRA